MNEASDTILEQLSAFMDGELSATEMRFLQRRLDADPQLRARWERMQLAATCMKGQPFRPMVVGVSEGIRIGIADVAPMPRRRPMLRWGMAASVMALALMFAPRLLRDDEPTGGGPGQVAAVSAGRNLVASPGTADLVAMQVDAPVRGAPEARRTASAAREQSPGDVLLTGANLPSAEESPIPLAAQSPTEFPLVEGGDERSWPQSGLARDSQDPALEAYLVRHNQLLANDGLGGFVPYVDVVTSEQIGAGEKAAAQPEYTGDAQR